MVLHIRARVLVAFVVLSICEYDLLCRGKYDLVYVASFMGTAPRLSGLATRVARVLGWLWGKTSGKIPGMAWCCSVCPHGVVWVC